MFAVQKSSKEFKMRIADEEGYVYVVASGICRVLAKTHEENSIEYVNAAGRLLDMYKVNPRRFFEGAFVKVGHVNTRRSTANG